MKITREMSEAQIEAEYAIKALFANFESLELIDDLSVTDRIFEEDAFSCFT